MFNKNEELKTKEEINTLYTENIKKSADTVYLRPNADCYETPQTKPSPG
jgi:hypothetical protein